MPRPHDVKRGLNFWLAQTDDLQPASAGRKGLLLLPILRPRRRGASVAPRGIGFHEIRDSRNGVATVFARTKAI